MLDDYRDEINSCLNDIYEQSAELGEKLAESGLGNSQIRGLEMLIFSTSRFSEIINYIKGQTGRDKTGRDKKGKWLKVFYVLINQLERLENKAKEIGENDPAKTLPIKLELAKGWIKQVVAHYLFSSRLNFIIKNEKEDIKSYMSSISQQSAMIAEQFSKIKLGKALLEKIEAIVASASNLSEISVGIKRMKVTDEDEQWAKASSILLEQLKKFDEKASFIGKGDREKTNYIQLILAREWIKQIVSHYFCFN